MKPPARSSAITPKAIAAIAIAVRIRWRRALRNASFRSVEAVVNQLTAPDIVPVMMLFYVGYRSFWASPERAPPRRNGRRCPSTAPSTCPPRAFLRTPPFPWEMGQRPSLAGRAGA